MAHSRQTTGTLSARLLRLAPACYPPLILGLAAFLIGLLCCRTTPPEYQAEAVILRDAGEVDGTSGDIETWLKSDAVLRAALTNARWPELTEGAVLDHSRRIAELRDRFTIT